MKKFFLLIITVSLCTKMIGCGEVLPQESMEDIIEDMLDDINVASIVFDDFDVPTTIEGFDISWTSNSDNLTIIDDEVIVYRDDFDEVGILTASTFYEDIEYSKNFNVFLPRVEFDENLSVEDYKHDHLFVLNFIDYTLQNEYNYHTQTTGSTEGSVKIALWNKDVKQDVEMNSYKYEDMTAYEIISETDKSPTGYNINVYQKGIFTKDVIKFSHARETITNTTPLKTQTKDEYIKDYGLSQYCHFSGYEVNEEDITSSSYEKINENHSFTFNINPGTASEKKLQQISVYGKLEDVSFNTISFTILIDDSFNIIEMNSTEKFTASMEGFSSTLTQKTTTTYNYFDPLDLPFESLGFDRYYNAL